MRKIINKVLFGILLTISIILFLYSGLLIFLFSNEEIIILGDKNFAGAQVYADNELVAIMTWDSEHKRTYAKDIHPTALNSIYTLFFDSNVSTKDSFLRPKKNASVVFTVITRDKKRYRYQTYIDENLFYNVYSLASFERINK